MNTLTTEDKLVLAQTYGTDDLEKVLQRKSEEQQTKLFASGKAGQVEMTAAKCQKLCDESGIEYQHGYEGRVLSYRVSDETQDRYGDVIEAKGANFDNYKKNPVIMFAHNYGSMPVGNSIKYGIDKSKGFVWAWGLFPDRTVDSTGWGDLTYKMARAGFLKACSVGLIPHEAKIPKTESEAKEMGVGKWGIRITKWDVLEWSPCGIPANPNALQNMFTGKTQKSLGVFQPEDLDLIVKASEQLSGKEEIPAGFDFFLDKSLVDMFCETVKGRTGKTYSYFVEGGTEEASKGATEETPFAAPAVFTVDEAAELHTKLDNILNELKSFTAIKPDLEKFFGVSSQDGGQQTAEKIKTVGEDGYDFSIPLNF